MAGKTSSGPAPLLGLVADIGGTNCRFALVERGSSTISAPQKLEVARHPDLQHAIHAYLNAQLTRPNLDWAVIAVAGAVIDNTVNMTNHSWRISGAELAAEFGMRDVRLVNDFAALARSAPLLSAQDLIQIGGGAPHESAGVTTKAMLGAGTGLGVGGLVSSPAGVFTLTTEGGHATFAPTDDLEFEIDRALRTRFERVSNERLLSGEGLVNIYWALTQIDDAPMPKLIPRDVTARAADKSDPRAVLTMEVFSRVMGAFAGDIALIMGARGGVYIAGGLTPTALETFDRTAFRARFEAKGRFRAYMQAIPTWIVTHPYAALLGALAFGGELIAPASAAAE